MDDVKIRGFFSTIKRTRFGPSRCEPLCGFQILNDKQHQMPTVHNNQVYIVRGVFEGRAL